MIKRALPNGKVNHYWKPHIFSPYYLWSACGEIAGYDYLVKRKLRHCKKCRKINLK